MLPAAKVPVSADYPLLRDVLTRELAGEGRDRTVEGGLDALLRTQARGEHPHSPLLRMVAALPAEGYRSLSPADREVWLRRALATVRRELALEEHLEPVRPDAAGGRGRSGRGPSARATKPKSPPAGDGPAAPARKSRAASRPGAAKKTAPASKAESSTSGGSKTAASKTPAAEKKIAPGAAGLDLPIEKAGTGLRTQALGKLDRLGIRTVGDALRHYPFRHVDFSRTLPINALRPGQEQTVRGIVDRSVVVPMGRGGRMKASEIWISDGFGRVSAVFFNQLFQVKNFPVGSEVAFAGKVVVVRGRTGFTNPEWERLDTEGGSGGRLMPVYHLTEGVAQRTLRGAIEKLLGRFVDRLEDPLPEAMRKRHHLMSLVEATRQAHYPDSEARLREAQRRLAFDELLAVQVRVQARKREWQAEGQAPALTDHASADAFLDTLPFTLTGAQQRVLGEVRHDLSRTVPMSRLLEGDVGSGKTAVALAAMLSAISEGYQAVLMAPTEVLAEQHYRTVCRLLTGEPEPPITGLVRVPDPRVEGGSHLVRVVLLTGSTLAKERRAAQDAIRHGGAHLIVGTHALIQEGVDYYRLGLAVVDEQHRFGVMQRGDLRRKGAESAASRGGTLTPHLLAMSATPIPRSLALTVYGDLDLSVIDEMPPGRTAIETKYLTPIQRREAFARVREEVSAGRQAFVICPLVEGSDTVQSRAATDEYERLRTEEYPDLADRILLLHGRMSAREKDRVMRAFADHEADILVSTAVVEVGIDVPNATAMIIEGADRFGLAQLHQFRGRVGRGDQPSVCYLLADDPTPEAEDRLSIMERTRDGFELAEADLQLRGPGDLFGTAQSGAPTLRVASLLDPTLIDAARREAETLLDEDPHLASAEHRALRYAIAERAASVVGEMH